MIYEQIRGQLKSSQPHDENARILKESRAHSDQTQLNGMETSR